MEIDPCRFIRPVKEIPWLGSHFSQSTRPLPARPAGESDSAARNIESGGSPVDLSSAKESHSPAAQGGRVLVTLCVGLATESPSPAARGGRGRRQPCCEAVRLSTSHPKMIRLSHHSAKVLHNLQFFAFSIFSRHRIQNCKFQNAN